MTWETETERENMAANRESLWRRGYGIYERPIIPTTQQAGGTPIATTEQSTQTEHDKQIDRIVTAAGSDEITRACLSHLLTLKEHFAVHRHYPAVSEIAEEAMGAIYRLLAVPNLTVAALALRRLRAYIGRAEQQGPLDHHNITYIKARLDRLLAEECAAVLRQWDEQHPVAAAVEKVREHMGEKIKRIRMADVSCSTCAGVAKCEGDPDDCPMLVDWEATMKAALAAKDQELAALRAELEVVGQEAQKWHEVLTNGFHFTEGNPGPERVAYFWCDPDGPPPSGWSVRDGMLAMYEVKLAEAVQEIERLKERVRTLEKERDDLQEVWIRQLNMGSSGKIDMTLVGDSTKALAGFLVENFYAQGGNNYLTTTIDVPATDEHPGHHLEYTIRNCDGTLTPQEKLAQQDQEIATLRAAIGTPDVYAGVINRVVEDELDALRAKLGVVKMGFPQQEGADVIALRARCAKMETAIRAILSAVKEYNTWRGPCQVLRDAEEALAPQSPETEP